MLPCFAPKVLKNLAQNFNPINAEIMVWLFDGRMAFVPEGQADRSQARSAWVEI
jgi:hypothetical protein